MKETESIINNFPKQKAQAQMASLLKSTQHLQINYSNFLRMKQLRNVEANSEYQFYHKSGEK